MDQSKQIPYVVRKAAESWARSLGGRALTPEEQALWEALSLPDAAVQPCSILLALADTASSREAAAELLGVSTRTLYARLNALDLHREADAQALRLGHPMAIGAPPAAYPRIGAKASTISAAPTKA